MKQSSAILLASLFLLSCSVIKQQTMRKESSLHFIDVLTLPHKMEFSGTTVGGLSGIDYDSKTGLFYLISDDRADINPVRFYTARISFNEGIDTIAFEGVHYLKTATGAPYPGRSVNPYFTPDPEALRLDARRSRISWSSEGERFEGDGGKFFYDGAVYFADRQGRTLDSCELPSQFSVQHIEKGPRRNGVFEALSYSHHYRYLYTANEEPLYNDGRRAGTGDSSALVRIIQFDAASGRGLKQFAYRIDPVRKIPNPLSAFKVAGVPDLLWLGGQRFIVVERSFSTGWPGCSIRLYEADLEGASDVSAYESLIGAKIREVPKKLLFDLDQLKIYIDNIEGICFGPTLPNGRQSLILVADDNFSTNGSNQFLLFEIR